MLVVVKMWMNVLVWKCTTSEKCLLVLIYRHFTYLKLLQRYMYNNISLLHTVCVYLLRFKTSYLSFYLFFWKSYCLYELALHVLIIYILLVSYLFTKASLMYSQEYRSYISLNTLNSVTDGCWKQKPRMLSMP